MKHKLARSLRQSTTDCEQLLWQRLRSRQLQGCKFRRPAPIGPYVVDFVCVERKLIVELDGGGHTQRREQDDVRTRWLESQGFTVLRFWNVNVREDLDCVLEGIWNSLHAAAASGTRLRVLKDRNNPKPAAAPVRSSVTKPKR